MLVLAFDTSSDVGSVAVLEGDGLRAEGVFAARGEAGRPRAAEVLLPEIDRVLTTVGQTIADVGLLVVGLGPGTFTGVRVGVSTAKGLALARRVPVVGVVSSRAMARGAALARRAVAAEAKTYVVTAIEAYKGEVFAALWEVGDDGATEPLVAPLHAPPAEAVERLRVVLGAGHGAGRAAVVLCGSGARRHERLFKAAFGDGVAISDPSDDVPRASHLGALGLADHGVSGAAELLSLEPLYVRPSDAELPARLASPVRVT